MAALLSGYALALLLGGVAVAVAVAVTEPMDDGDLEGLAVALLDAAILSPLWLAATVAAFRRLARFAGVHVRWSAAFGAALLAGLLAAATAWVTSLLMPSDEVLGVVIAAGHVLAVGGLALLVRRAPAREPSAARS